MVAIELVITNLVILALTASRRMWRVPSTALFSAREIVECNRIVIGSHVYGALGRVHSGQRGGNVNDSAYAYVVHSVTDRPQTQE